MNKTCLITGGAKRIGKSICLALANSGWDVAIHYNESEQEAEDLKAQISEIGTKSTLIQAAFSSNNAEKYDSIIQKVELELGKISLLVNSASSFEYDTAISATRGNLLSSFECNFLAPFLLTQALHKSCKDREKLSDCLTVNILDQKIINPNPDFFSYTLSKFTLLEATKLMALEMAPELRVVGLSPGVTMKSQHQSQENFDECFKKTPLGRSSSPEDIAGTILWLAENKSITGVNIVVDGGQHLFPSNRDVMFTVS